MCIVPRLSHALSQVPAGRGNFRPLPPQAAGRGGYGTSGAQVLRAGRQGAPEAADRVALSWPVRGVRKGVPPRLGESLRPAPRPPAARRRAVSAAPTARRWNSPRPASSATRREPHQPLAHLLGAWPPAKALLDWRRGDKGGRDYFGPAPSVGVLKGVGGSAPLTAQRLGLAGEGPYDASTARPPRLASATMPRSFLVRKSACPRRRPNYSELHDSSPGE